MSSERNLNASAENPADKNLLILIVSTKFDPHVDMIIEPLTRKSIPFVRFNTEDYPLQSKLSISFNNESSKQELKFPNNPAIKGDNVTAIWYRRPASFEFPKDFSVEASVFADKETRAVVQGLWKIIDCLWVNDPDLNRIAELKINQLKRAKSLGFNIPQTLITNDPDKVIEFFKKNKGDIVVKTLSGGIIGEGNEATGIYSSVIRNKKLASIDLVKYTPTLFQEYVPKRSELRITVVGNQVFAAEIDSQSNPNTIIDWRRDIDNVPHRIFNLPETESERCLKLVRSFGLNFGAIDMIRTPENDLVFLEINPNGQWAWIEDATGMPISKAMVNLLSGIKFKN